LRYASVCHTAEISKRLDGSSSFDIGTTFDLSYNVKKVKFSHTRYRALGPELIPVYRQSARR